MIAFDSTSDSASSLVERLADEMAAEWQRGRRVLTETLLDRVPTEMHSASLILDLLAEELALREEFREPIELPALVARFPEFAAQIRALVECQRVLGSRSVQPEFPNLGEKLGEFHLLGELGRGAAGRVYLATQSTLANRPVVLKVTQDRGTEHLSLARLQHTNIVPLYSAHDYPARGLRALCLPYFGGATLADLWRTTETDSGPCQNGAEILARLQRVQHRTVIVVPVHGAACEFLSSATLVDAVCWIGACLADALQYAHDRGLLHLDLKPSNVLIAADGVPMLLDFHLAREPLRVGGPPPKWLGGTPGFMPPEQEAALQSVRAGETLSADVDERADVFALGQLLTKTLRASLGDSDSAIPWGVRDILARSTDPEVKNRYSSAAEFAADLRRHLTNRPLRGVKNRSLAERWQKWRRRQPHALALGLAFAAITVGTASWGIHAQRQSARGWDKLREGESLLSQNRFAEAAEAFRGGEALVSGLPFQQTLRTRLREDRQAAERELVVENLHRLVERIRPLYGADVVTAEQSRTAWKSCQDIWKHRDTMAKFPVKSSTARADLLDLGILTAHLTLRAAQPGHDAEARDAALAVLREAESLLGSNDILRLERAILTRQPAKLPTATESAQQPRTAWEHTIIGRAYLALGDAHAAEQELDKAVQLDPSSFWANYERGRCAVALGDAADAVVSFTACLALEPNRGWCWYNRGLAFAEAGRPQRAWDDFDRALQHDPSLANAILARGVAKARCGSVGEGFQDVQLAADRGIPLADVNYHKALIHLHLDDTAAAKTCLNASLQAAPNHRPSHELLQRLGK